MRESLNIAFFASSPVPPCLNGAAPGWRGIVPALQQRGQRIVLCEADAFDRQARRDASAYCSEKVIVYAGRREDDVLRARAQQLRGVDAVVKANDVRVIHAPLERGVLPLNAPGSAALTLSDVDAPATSERSTVDAPGPWRDLIPPRDSFSTHGGGPQFDVAATA